jgi:hypothetical protein
MSTFSSLQELLNQGDVLREWCGDESALLRAVEEFSGALGELLQAKTGYGAL